MFLPEGDEALMPHLAFMDDARSPWRPDPLLLCGSPSKQPPHRVRSRRKERAPGGRDHCVVAVPGYFADVAIDGESYVDGGVISATNADVLARHDIDLAIVVSPMTGASGGPSFDRSIRRFCRRTLDHEMRRSRPERHTDGRHRTRHRGDGAISR